MVLAQHPRSRSIAMAQLRLMATTSMLGLAEATQDPLLALLRISNKGCQSPIKTPRRLHHANHQLLPGEYTVMQRYRRTLSRAPGLVDQINHLVPRSGSFRSRSDY